ncbi:MAG TPA: DUF6159 family protein [Chitinophagaceae bacterium]|nr:DUF6159 family protein [Chitinophagaceae bacterium]
MSFFDRLSNGWKIAMNSFKILKANQQLIIFPVLSGLSLILIIGSFFFFVLGSADWDIDKVAEPGATGSYLLVLLFYVVNYFVVVFFNMALIHCTRLYFKGEEVTVRKGLAFSMSRIGVIFSWSLFAGTVGAILKIVQEESGLIGKIITGVLGVVWSIATFFVVPVIAYENLGPLAAFKRSSQLMKQKWGESLGATFSFGLIQFVGILIVGLVLFLLGYLIDPVAGIALAILGAFIVITIISAAQTIFVSAVYHDVTDEPVVHFNKKLIDELFVSKKG